MYLGNVMLLVLNLPLVGLWVQMLRVPYGILAPVIVLFTTIGSTASKTRFSTFIRCFSFPSSVTGCGS